MTGSGQSSESTSYNYLPYVSPQTASIIGQYQSQAADSAAQLATKSVNDAMASITKNFTSATDALRPATQSGVQAQNELNRYLGLSAYNPGSAPVAPKNINDWAPSNNDIQDYVKQNSYISQLGRNPSAMPDGSDSHAYTVYNGVGAKYDGWSKLGNFGNNDPASGVNVIGLGGQGDVTSGQRQQITDYLKQRYVENNQDLYDADTQQYSKDLENYNLYKQWYDQSPGAYTTQQVQDNISSQPGYQAQLDEGVGSIQKAASARGLIGSGNMLKDLTSFASQLEGQYYSDTLNRLAQQAAQGTSAASQVSQNYTGQGSALASLKSQLGDTLANSALAKGQALASSYQLGNTQYQKVISGQSSASSGGGGLSGIGSILGGLGSLAQSGMFSSKTYKTKGKNAKLDLRKLEELPVEKWKYKKSTKIDPTGEEHIGPYAEDFKKVFGVGDGKSIPIVSAVGILYGLVKELNQKIEGK